MSKPTLEKQVEVAKIEFPRHVAPEEMELLLKCIVAHSELEVSYQTTQRRELSSDADVPLNVNNYIEKAHGTIEGRFGEPKLKFQITGKKSDSIREFEYYQSFTGMRLFKKEKDHDKVHKNESTLVNHFKTHIREYFKRQEIKR